MKKIFILDKPNLVDGGLRIVYFSLFSLSYISIFVFPAFSKVFLASVLIFSYIKLIVFRDKNVVLYLILFSRCINGFMGGAYYFWVATTWVLPFLIVIVQSIPVEKRIPVKWKKHIIFGSFVIVVMLLYSVFNMNLAIYAVKLRVIPLVMLVLAIVVGWTSIDLYEFIIFSRFIGVITIFVFLIPEYHLLRTEFILQPIVFPEAVNAIPPFDLLRNWGIFWDARMVGIFSYSVIYLSIRTKHSFHLFDIFLNFLIILSSISRGSIMVGICLIIYYVFQNRTKIRFKHFAIISTSIILIVGLLNANISESQRQINNQTFMGIVGFGDNSVNPLEQREGFAKFAMNKFISNPGGYGMGYLVSPNATHNVVASGAEYSRVTDAFLCIILAEIGLIGGVAFLGFIFYYLYDKTKLSILFYFLLLVQFYGTNIPDMGVFFFVFLVAWGFEFSG